MPAVSDLGTGVHLQFDSNNNSPTRALDLIPRPREHASENITPIRTFMYDCPNDNVSPNNGIGNVQSGTRGSSGGMFASRATTPSLHHTGVSSISHTDCFTPARTGKSPSNLATSYSPSAPRDEIALSSSVDLLDVLIPRLLGDYHDLKSEAKQTSNEFSAHESVLAFL